MFNGLHVLSALLVCSTVFFGCVAPAEVAEVWDDCKDALHEVELVKTCFRHADFYLFGPILEHTKKIIKAIVDKACKWD